MTSSEEGLIMLGVWSIENTPCSISVAGKGFSLSSVGTLNMSTSAKEIKLSWGGGDLSFDLEASPDLEILEGGTLQLRLPFEMFVLICQSPDMRNKTVN